MGLLSAVIFVMFGEAILESKGAACEWHCRKNILVSGLVYLGIVIFRVLILYITHYAWFRANNTMQASAGPCKGPNIVNTDVGPFNPGLDSGLSVLV